MQEPARSVVEGTRHPGRGVGKEINTEGFATRQLKSSHPFLSRYLYLWPITEPSQLGLAGTAGVYRGSHIKEAAQHVVLHP
jgi:hypothetical protein